MVGKDRHETDLNQSQEPLVFACVNPKTLKHEATKKSSGGLIVQVSSLLLLL